MPQSLRLALAILAVWRLTHLVAREDGPWGVLRSVRHRTRSRMVGRLLACFYCLSVWTALPFALFVGGTLVERAVTWWAISGAAILLERMTAEPLAAVAEDVEGEADGVLRSGDRTIEH